MLNQLLKFTLISSLLLWLKPRWRGLLGLSVVVVVVHVFHGEYLDYAELSGSQSFLVWSYIIKWSALIVAVVVYIAYVIYVENGRKTSRNAIPSQKNAMQRAIPIADDGFDFLRRKTKLQNQADKITGEQSK